MGRGPWDSALGALLGRRYLRGSRPHANVVERALPKGGQHGQNLAAGARRGGPNLAQMRPVRDDRDVDVNDRSTLYV